MLRSQGFDANANQLISDHCFLFLDRFTHFVCITCLGAFLSAGQCGTIDAFLKRTHKFGFYSSLFYCGTM